MGKIALICVDVQADFLPGGALAVPHGEEVIAPLVEAAGRENIELVVATRDLHPRAHVSFKSVGGPWPAHCVIGTTGAEIHPAIREITNRTISKGLNPGIEQYSAFSGTHLGEMLRAEGFTSLLIGGLATDYCVKETVLDALKEGFEVDVLSEACRAVNVSSMDEKAAYLAMSNAGALLIDRDLTQDALDIAMWGAGVVPVDATD